MAALEPSPSSTPPRGWRLLRVAGVPVHLRGSALVTLAVLWGVLYVQLAAGVLRPWWEAPTLATVACLAFLVSVIGHELAHALVARGLGLAVTAVSVFHLGGVTRLERDPEDPRDEALVAVAGPLVNVLAAGVLIVAGVVAGPVGPVGGLLVFVGHLNVLLGVCNLLPGHPLDGGALVRSAVWAATGDPDRALRLSGGLGQAVGAALLVAGVVGAVPGGPGVADPAWLWVAAIGALLIATARLGMAHAGVRLRLAGLRVGDLSRTIGVDVPAHTTVAAARGRLVDGRAALVLDAAGTPVGTLGPEEVAAVPSTAHQRVTAAEAMRPLLGAVEAEDELLAVLPRFRRTRDSTVAVVVEGRAVGVLAASDVLDHLDGRSPARR